MTDHQDAARDEILRRIRVALHAEQAGITEQHAGATFPAQSFRRSDQQPASVHIATFIERVSEYRATVQEVNQSGLPHALAAACQHLRLHRVVVPSDLPSAWLMDLPAINVEVIADGGLLTTAELDACDGVITGCALGIAQTGTIVLDSGLAQGRRALSLVPDVHFCVINEGQIVSLVPEAVAALAPIAQEARRPITFISGPSATSDIELNRVEGVHGPRNLVVFVVRPDEQDVITEYFYDE